MRKGHDAIHIGWQRLPLIAARDPFGGVRGAIACRDHGDVVARAHAAVFARVSHENRRVSHENRRVRAVCGWRNFSDGIFVIELKLLERQVMRMDVLARGDRRGLGQGLQTLGTIELIQHNYQSAAALLLEALSICLQVNNQERAGRCLRGLACVTSSLGAWTTTAHLLGAAEGVAPLGAAVSGALKQLFEQAAADTLDHLGLAKSAAAVRQGVATVLKAGKPRTPDLGGTATTTAVTEAVLAAI